MDISRRYILAALGSGIGTSGLIAGYTTVRDRAYSKGYDRAKERYTTNEKKDPTAFDDVAREIDREVTINPDSYENVKLDIDQDTFIEAAVVADIHIDVLMLDSSNFHNYENGEDDIEYMTSYSELDTSETVIRESIGSGEFNFVVDNTAKGKATPRTSDPIHTEVVILLRLHQK